MLNSFGGLLTKGELNLTLEVSMYLMQSEIQSYKRPIVIHVAKEESFWYSKRLEHTLLQNWGLGKRNIYCRAPVAASLCAFSWWRNVKSMRPDRFLRMV
jgi:hypothetical protein